MQRFMTNMLINRRLNYMVDIMAVGSSAADAVHDIVNGATPFKSLGDKHARIA